MNFYSQYTSVFGVAILTLGLAAGAISPYFVEAPALAAPATSFPDTENYWAQPFIQSLAKRDIVTGYLDNTYRPEQPVDRDEFAAILRQAFSQAPERQLSSGSVYKDVPKGYWAASAIEEAYETGFMKGYPNGDFRPNQSISRVEVLVSLARNLDLSTTTVATAKPVVGAVARPAPVQPPQRQRAKRPLMFPLAITMLMQPLVTTPARATAAVNSVPATTRQQRSAPIVVSDYYQDAAQIPQYAVDSVAAATAARIVVNYPNQRLLHPTRPATRGEVAALVHQALVTQGKVAPITDQTATQYVVGRR